jgi:hypothetical protein
MLLVTGNIWGIAPMPTMLPDNQSMTPMTTNFTNNTGIGSVSVLTGSILTFLSNADVLG